MGKTSEKVTKDPKRQERGKKAYETHMKKLRKQILENNQLPTHSPTDRPTPSTSSSTSNSTPSIPSFTSNSTHSTLSHTARSDDTYVYWLYLSLVFVYFLHITLLKVKIKNSINEKQDQRPK